MGPTSISRGIFSTINMANRIQNPYTTLSDKEKFTSIKKHESATKVLE